MGAYYRKNEGAIPRIVENRKELDSIFLRLSKEGYGSFIEIKKGWSVKEVVNAIHYSNFLNDFQAAFMELRK